MIKEIFILLILTFIGWYGLFRIKKETTKEKYIFLGFVILLFTIIYSVSILGYKVGGAVDISKIETTKKEIYDAKRDVENMAKDILEISYIIADGTGRWGGMPSQHLTEIKKIQDNLFKKLSVPPDEVIKLEKSISDKIEKINKDITEKGQVESGK